MNECVCVFVRVPVSVFKIQGVVSKRSLSAFVIGITGVGMVVVNRKRPRGQRRSWYGVRVKVCASAGGVDRRRRWWFVEAAAPELEVAVIRVVGRKSAQSKGFGSGTDTNGGRRDVHDSNVTRNLRFLHVLAHLPLTVSDPNKLLYNSLCVCLLVFKGGLTLLSSRHG